MNTLLIVLKDYNEMLNQILNDLVSKHPDSVVTIKRYTLIRKLLRTVRGGYEEL